MVSSPKEENRDAHSLILASTSKSNSRQTDDEDQEQLKNLSLHIDISKVLKFSKERQALNQMLENPNEFITKVKKSATQEGRT